MRTLHLVLAALLVLAVFSTAPAAAQSPEEIVDQGTAAFQAGDYERAVEFFQQAFNLDPHPVIMFNLARAYHELGDLPAALLHYKSIRTLEAPPHVLDAAEAKIVEVETSLRDQGYDPDVVTSVEYVPRGDLAITTQPAGASVYLDGDYRGITPYQASLVDSGVYALRLELDGYHPVTQDIEVHGLRNNLRSFNLTPRTTLEEYVPPSPGYLTVRAPVSGLQVEVDGEPFGTTPVLAERLSPGTYVVTIRGENWLPYSETVEVVSAENSELVARMTAVNATEITDPHRNRRLAGTAVMAASGAAFATGAAFGVIALNKASDYRDNRSDPDRGDYRDAARTNALIADISYATGGVLFVTGALLRWVNAGEDQDVDSNLMVRPTSGPGLGLGLNATW